MPVETPLGDVSAAASPPSGIHRRTCRCRWDRPATEPSVGVGGAVGVGAMGVNPATASRAGDRTATGRHTDDGAPESPVSGG